MPGIEAAPSNNKSADARPHPPAIPAFIRDRRWWLPLFGLWAYIVGLAYLLQSEEAREQAMRVAVEGSRNMFRVVVFTRAWNASHGGVYVPITEHVQPNEYLDHPLRDVTTTDGMALTMVNPAYMTRLIAEIAAAESGTRFRITSLRPVQPANKPDRWEAQGLHAFERGEKEHIAVTQAGGTQELRYMAPLVVTKACLSCHEKQDYKLGDIRGGISISVPYAPIEAAVLTNRHRAQATHLAVFALVLVLGWILLEMLRRRWFELHGTFKDLENSQHQLIQSEKMAAVGQLAAGVAHEINNPIGFVKSNLGSLRSYTKTLIELIDACRAGKATEADFVAADYEYIKTDLDSLLGESNDGLERVRKIVADLKDFSHVDKAEWQEFDLNAGIESTLNVVWHELKYKADVVREYGSLPPVPCIGSQINQVVMNLLVNAVQAIEEHGTITIRTGHDETKVWIRIEDTGQGMPPEVAKRIFEPFYTTKPVGQGTGLGLSLSYDIVTRHGGSIEVHSVPGQGSTFSIFLPLHAPHVSPTMPG